MTAVPRSLHVPVCSACDGFFEIFYTLIFGSIAFSTYMHYCSLGSLKGPEKLASLSSSQHDLSTHCMNGSERLLLGQARIYYRYILYSIKILYVKL